MYSIYLPNSTNLFSMATWTSSPSRKESSLNSISSIRSSGMEVGLAGKAGEDARNLKTNTKLIIIYRGVSHIIINRVTRI